MGINFKNYCTDKAIHQVVDTYVADKNVQISKDESSWTVADGQRELKVSSKPTSAFATIGNIIGFAFKCLRPGFYAKYTDAIRLMNTIENNSTEKTEKIGGFILQNIPKMKTEEGKVTVSKREAINALPHKLRELSPENRKEYIETQIHHLTDQLKPEDHKGMMYQDENGVFFVCDGTEWKFPEIRTITPQYFQGQSDEQIKAYIDLQAQEFNEKYAPADFEGQSIIDSNGIQFYSDGEKWSFKE